MLTSEFDPAGAFAGSTLRLSKPKAPKALGAAASIDTAAAAYTIAPAALLERRARIPCFNSRTFPMPIYEYRCENGHTFEVFQSMSDEPVSTCEVCGAPVERVFHPVAVHFKGSGFYTTDYAKKGAAKTANDGDSKSESKAESGSESKSSSSETSTKSSSSSD
jgi:putative FmdB family regulatory protein